jgi:carbon-monoxide dehydrogenase medium subunit/xanthine dehydrogenase FAD-binding subunit
MEIMLVKPKGLKEVVEYLDRERGTLIAGGTDLIVEKRQGKQFTGPFIDISTLEELRKIEYLENKCNIGACCTHSDIEKSELIENRLPMLKEACSSVGSTLIRNRGTIGGNIVNNAICADSVPPLLIYDAKVNLQSVDNERSIALKDFFLTKGLDLRKNELLKSIEVEPLKRYRWKLIKVGRRKSLAISRLTLALALKESNGIIEDIRICPGAMLPRHGRLWNTEHKFKGERFDQKAIEAIAECSTAEAVSLSARRWSAEYKEAVLKGLIIKTLEEWRD